MSFAYFAVIFVLLLILDLRLDKMDKRIKQLEDKSRKRAIFN